MDDDNRRKDSEYRKKAEAELEKRLRELDALSAASDEIAATAPSEKRGFSVTELYGAPHALFVPDGKYPRGDATIHDGHRTRLRGTASRDVTLDGLSDIELVELLLTFFVPRKDVNVAAHILLAEFGSIFGLLNATEKQLRRFPFITERAAVMLPRLAYVSVAEGMFEAHIQNQQAALELFRFLFSSDDAFGTYFAFISDNFRLIAVERMDDMRMRPLASAVTKYGARYVYVGRRDREMFPDAFDLRSITENMTDILDGMGVRLLDFSVFTDYGYYSLGRPPKAGGWYPLYVFVPDARFMRTPEMLASVSGADAEGNSSVAQDGLRTIKQLSDIVKTDGEK